MSNDSYLKKAIMLSLGALNLLGPFDLLFVFDVNFPKGL